MQKIFAYIKNLIYLCIQKQQQNFRVMTREELNKEIERISAETPIIDRKVGSDKGYIPANSYYIGEYNGRYGKGYKIYHPNKDGIRGKVSGRFHAVEYLIIEK